MTNTTEPQTLWAYYNLTAGYVERPSSRERATREIADGSLSRRQEDIMKRLDFAGTQGMIWKELADATGLHHGKISGALSNMHKGGMVFMLRKKVKNCHPYVSVIYRHLFYDIDCYDEPVKTKTQASFQALLEACDEAKVNGYSLSSRLNLEKVLREIRHND